MNEVVTLGKCSICKTMGDVRKVDEIKKGKPVLMCTKCEKEDDRNIELSVSERIRNDSGETFSHTQVLEEIEKIKNKNVVNLSERR